MKTLLACFAALLLYVPTYSQLLLITDTTGSNNNWFTYVDTTSFVDVGYNSVDGNYYYFEENKKIKSNKKVYEFKVISSKKPIDYANVSIKNIENINWMRLLCGFEHEVYIERWLERQEALKNKDSIKTTKALRPKE